MNRIRRELAHMERGMGVGEAARVACVAVLFVVGLMLSTPARAVDSVILQSPTAGHQTTRSFFILKWSVLADTVGIDSYHLQLARDSQFTMMISEDTIRDPNVSDTPDNLNNDSFYWRVRAIDDSGVFGPFFDTRGFVVDTIVNVVRLNSPDTGHQTVGNPVIAEWTALADSVGIDSYVVQMLRAGYNVQTFIDTINGSLTSETLALNNDSYVWRVQAMDNLGNVGAFSDSRGILHDTDVDTVNLIAPTNGHQTTGGTVIVDWPALADSVGIDSYVVQLLLAGSGTPILADTINGADRRDTLALNNDSYVWRVQAMDNLGNVSAFSDSRGILHDTDVDTVNLAGPSNNHQTRAQFVHLFWSTLADSVGVDSFIVHVSTMGNFDVVIQEDTLNGSILIDTFAGPGNDTYYWRVRAIDNLGNAGVFGETRAFLHDTRVATVTLAGPADNHTTTVAAVNFFWNAVIDSSGIDSYVVQVAFSSLFTSLSFEDTVDGITTIDTFAGLANVNYWWRVQAIDNLGNTGSYSDSRTFLIDNSASQVPLDSPPNGHQTNAARVQVFWSPPGDSSGIDSYVVQADNDSQFTSLAFEDTVDAAQRSDTFTGLANDTYYWRVRAVDLVGNVGAFSDTRGFLVDTFVGAVALVAPANGAALSSTVVLSWIATADSAGIDSYAVEVSKFDTFSPLAFADTVNGPNITDTVTTALATDTYYWRVQAVDRLGNRQFATGAIAAETRVFRFSDTLTITLRDPSDGHSTLNTRPTLAWISTDTSATFTIQIAAGSSFSALVETRVVADTTLYTPASALADSAYFWRVVGQLDNGATDTSASRTFTISLDTTGQPARFVLQNNHQLGSISAALADSLAVRVFDDSGNLVRGETLTFSIAYPASGAGASLGVSTVATDTGGLAYTTLTLGTSNESYRVRVTSTSNGALSAAFHAYTDAIDVSAKSWKLVAPNKAVSSSSVSTLIGDDLTTARTYAWNENAGASPGLLDYVVPSAIERGRGYWVYDDNGGRLTFQGTAGFDTVTVTLTAGWHTIGTGQYFFVDWDSDVRFDTDGTKLTPAQAASAGVVNNAVYWYSGGSYKWGPDPGTSLAYIQLKPQVGFFIYTPLACTMTVFPNPRVPVDSASAVLAQAPPLDGDAADESDWTMGFTVSGGGVTAGQHYIGVKPDGPAILAANRRAPPPAVQNYISLHVKASDGARYAARYEQPVAAATVWDLEMNSDLENENITIRWNNLRNVPDQYDLYLTGTAHGPVNMRQRESITLESGSGGLSGVSFAVVVGRPEFLSGLLAPPLDGSLTFAYPNPGPDPATGRVTFGYNLNAASDVSLKIFDVAGRERFVALQSAVPAGNQTYIWPAVDRHGRTLGSGVYIYIIEAIENGTGARTRQIDKLAIVR